MATADPKQGGSNNSLLQFQNQKLSAQLEVQRKEINELENQVKELKNKGVDYADTLLCVNRYWNQLHSDIQILCRRLDIAPPTDNGKVEEKPQVEVKKEQKAKDRACMPDPFLERLLQQDSAAVDEAQQLRKEIWDEATNVEEQLAARCTTTRACLVSVLDTIDAEQKRKHEDAATLATNANDPELKERVEALVREAELAKREADAACGVKRTLHEALQQADDLRVKLESTIKELQTELEELGQNYLTLQRKVASQRTSNDGGGAGEAAARPDARLSVETNAELEEIHKLASKRAADLEQERETVARLTRELREVRAASQDESVLMGSRLQQAQIQINALLTEVERLRVSGEAVQRERDDLKCRLSLLQLQVDSVSHVRAVASQMEMRVKEVEGLLRAAQAATDEAELKLQREKEKTGQSKTVGELKLMVATLQKEIGVLQASLAKQKGLADQIDAFRQEALDSRAALRAQELVMERLREQAGEQRDQLGAAHDSQQSLQDEVEDLRVFVQVLEGVAEEEIDVAQLHASEARLRDQVASLTAQLDGHSLQETIAALKKKVAEKEAEMGEVWKEIDRVRVEAANVQDLLKDLEEQLDSAKAEAKAYLKEMEVIGGAYEDMQAQNTRLLQLLTERDDANNQLANETLRLNQQVARSDREAETAQAELSRAENRAILLQSHICELEVQLQAATEEVGVLRERGQQYAGQAEVLLRRLAEGEESARQKDLVVESAQRQAAEKRKLADDAEERCLKERNKRQLMEDELKVLNGKLEKMRKVEEAGGAAKQMQSEIKGLRIRLNCNVCQEREKNVIITKCWHMFCEPCIKKNLDARNRKCPGCGSLFGSADVKRVFFM